MKEGQIRRENINMEDRSWTQVNGEWVKELRLKSCSTSSIMRKEREENRVIYLKQFRNAHRSYRIKIRKAPGSFDEEEYKSFNPLRFKLKVLKSMYRNKLRILKIYDLSFLFPGLLFTMHKADTIFMNQLSYQTLVELSPLGADGEGRNMKKNIPFNYVIGSTMLFMELKLTMAQRKFRKQYVNLNCGLNDDKLKINLKFLLSTNANLSLLKQVQAVKFKVFNKYLNK